MSQPSRRLRVQPLPDTRWARSIGTTIDERGAVVHDRDLEAARCAAARTALLVRAIDLESISPELPLTLDELTLPVEGRPALAVRVAKELEDVHRYVAPLTSSRGPS
ncbi:hypothetical protein ACQEVM_18675 [Streptomyces sp. CA-243310]|uniref:hypothetical protein n=1 Tax=Streptomyces sp. CA-243310 TaxID=3240056 RepID=UPI003D8C6536